MVRSWNVTGLYKASRDRPGARRSRKLPTMGLPSGARLVVVPADLECSQCGFGVGTRAHKMLCSVDTTKEKP